MRRSEDNRDDVSGAQQQGACGDLRTTVMTSVGHSHGGTQRSEGNCGELVFLLYMGSRD